MNELTNGMSSEERLREALARISLTEADTTTPAVEKVRYMARTAREALAGSPSTHEEGWVMADFTKEQIDAMVNRFLTWKLPPTFGPDCFVSFDREKAKANQSWPVGTNLLTADEARAMLEYVLTPPTFAERCRIAQECLPHAEYRTRLTALHEEMLAALSRDREDERGRGE